MQNELVRLEALYREAQRAMLNAAADGNDAMLTYWASRTYELFVAKGQYRTGYDNVFGAYDAAVIRDGRQMPGDIEDFDPDNIEWVPVLPPSQGGPYT